MPITDEQVWAELQVTALQLIAEAERAHVDIDSIVDATLTAFPQLSDCERYREALRAFIRDVIPPVAVHPL